MISIFLIHGQFLKNYTRSTFWVYIRNILGIHQEQLREGNQKTERQRLMEGDWEQSQTDYKKKKNQNRVGGKENDGAGEGDCIRGDGRNETTYGLYNSVKK